MISRAHGWVTVSGRLWKVCNIGIIDQDFHQHKRKGITRYLLTGNCSLRGHSGGRCTKSILAWRSVFPGQMCFFRDGRASHFSCVLTRRLQVSWSHVVSDTVITGSSVLSPPYSDITSRKPDQSCPQRRRKYFYLVFSPLILAVRSIHLAIGI